MANRIIDDEFCAEIVETDISDLCRICGSPSDSPLVPIYEGNGLVQELASKIMQHLPIKISQEDILPVKSCISCTNVILTWHLLYECCVDADRRFQTILADEQIDSVLEKDIAKIKHSEEGSKDDKVQNTSHHEMEDVMFLQAEFGPEDEQYLDDDVAGTPDEDDDKGDDKKNVEQTASYENYLELPSSPTSADFFSIEADQSSKLAIDIVPTDNITQLNDNSLGTVAIEEIFKCPSARCEGIFSKIEFCTHLVNEHKDEHEILIMLRNNDSSRFDTQFFNTARITVNKRIMFKCPDCDKLLSTKCNFRNHLHIHKDERPYACLLCLMQFRSHTNIVRHIQRTHLKIKKFSCEICQKNFTSRVNLRQHYNLHSNNQSYVCDTCGKGFRQKSSLFLHSKTHDNTFPFSCSYCGKGFRFKRPMIIHMSIHTGEKTNSCDICGKNFRIKGDLKKHRQLHGAEKPFECSECSEAFKQKRYLSRHMKSRHSDLAIKESPIK